MTTLLQETDTLTILVPANEVEPTRAELAPRPASLDGLRLGVLDNGKPNSDRLLAMLANRVHDQGGAVVTTVVRKPAIGRLAPADVVEELLATSDVIITGVGDCAGCCSCTIADAIAFEQRGVPVAAVCTTEFVTAAAVAAASAGVPGYETAVLPHPFGSCTDEVLGQRAASITSRILELLTYRLAGKAIP